MNALPSDITAILAPFAPVSGRPVFEHARVLACCALLAIGKRTVTSASRVMSLSWCNELENHHRVLNRDKWSGRLASYILLMLLVRVFAAVGPNVTRR